MKNSPFLKVMLTVAAFALAVGPTAVSAQDKPMELTISASNPKEGRYICGFKPWAGMVEKAAGGKVKITFSFGRSPGDPYENVLKGATTDITSFPYGFTNPKYFPLTKVFGLLGASIGIKDPIMASWIFRSLYEKFPEIQNEHKSVYESFSHG